MSFWDKVVDILYQVKDSVECQQERTKKELDRKVMTSDRKLQQYEKKY